MSSCQSAARPIPYITSSTSMASHNLKPPRLAPYLRTRLPRPLRKSFDRTNPRPLRPRRREVLLLLNILTTSVILISLDSLQRRLYYSKVLILLPICYSRSTASGILSFIFFPIMWITICTLIYISFYHINSNCWSCVAYNIAK